MESFDYVYNHEETVSFLVFQNIKWKPFFAFMSLIMWY